jgi:hypothetical protein
MANLEKHPRSAMREWQDAEENPIPTHARSPQVLGHYNKNRKFAPARDRFWLAKPAEPQQAPSLESGEAGRMPKIELKRSQAASFDHLLKKSRLLQLRQPVQVKKVEPHTHLVEKGLKRAAPRKRG